MSKDTIYRQDAVEEIDEWIKAFLENGHKESAADACLIQDGIIQLPSAQPDIIQCKDCKHYKAYEYTGYLACHYVVGGTVRRDLDDFCSRAERRTNERFD